MSNLNRLTACLSRLDLARDLLPFALDPIQVKLLTTTAGFVVLNCHRQWGKTTITGLCALHQAISAPRQLIVVISPTLEQSKILTRRCRDFARQLGLPITTDGTNPRSVQFPNGSLILPIAADAEHARGWSAHLLIIDEAAFVDDAVYAAVTPLIAATRGRIWLLSTPNGKRGFFYREFSGSHHEHQSNLRLSAPAEGPGGSNRLSPDFLAVERSRKTVAEFAQEYLCEFTTTEHSAFREEIVQRAFRQDLVPFLPENNEGFGHLAVAPYYYLGVDLGKKQDHAVLSLIEFRVIPTGTLDPYTRSPLFRRELHLRYLHQFPLGTPYLSIVPRIAQLCRHPQLEHRCSLVVDATGHGECVVELIRAERLPVNFVPVSITAGQHATLTPWGRNVPKNDLITRLELLLEKKHLFFAENARGSDILRRELLQFERIQHPDGHTTYGPADSITHDDTVLATALAAWWAWENRKSHFAGPRHKPLDLWS